jgi:radical SAM superfamily enzyme YgiQ (UPF0313 family)
MITTLLDKHNQDMNGHVLIVDPPWNIHEPNKNGTRASSRWPHEYPANRIQSCIPFFMGYACAYLKANHVNAHMSVYSPPRISYQIFLDHIIRRKYRIVLVETAAATIKSDLDFCRDLKANLDCLIGCVGGYASAAPDECIKNDTIDAVLKGEYERNALEFVQTEVCKIYDYNITKDINTLPFVDRSDIIFKDILSNNGTFRAKYKKQYQLWGSRGCPFKCSFCMYPPVMYNRAAYRPRSAENIAVELDYLIRINGNNHFHIWFDDDTFNIGEKRMMEIADVFKQRDIQYAAMCRADTIKNFDTLEHMARCGFIGCAVGVESGCQELVDGCNKDLSLNDVIRFRKWCKTLNIYIHMTFTLGLKGETEETIKRTRNFISTVNPDSYQVSGCSPVQGTSYHNYLKQKGIIDHATKLDGSEILNVKEINESIR